MEVRYDLFPISRDPPEGGTTGVQAVPDAVTGFPISRDPPEGGTVTVFRGGELPIPVSNF